MESDLKIIVEDENGKFHDFSDILKSSSGYTAVFFIRHFGWYTCADFVTSLQKKCEEFKSGIDESKANMMVIGCGDAKNLANYRKETGFKGPLYSDHKRDLYKLLQLYVSKGMSEFKSDKASPYASTGFVSGMAWSMKEVLFSSGMGDIFQQGGDFVFTPEGEIVFQHVHQHPNDHSIIEDVFKAAGVKVQ